MNDTQHDHNFTNQDGNPAGGISTGIGYTIAWQTRPCPILEDGSQPARNGAFLIEVLEACESRLAYYRANGDLDCFENEMALDHLTKAVKHLRVRRDRRKDAGTLGTHEKD